MGRRNLRWQSKHGYAVLIFVVVFLYLPFRQVQAVENIRPALSRLSEQIRAHLVASGDTRVRDVRPSSCNVAASIRLIPLFIEELRQKEVEVGPRSSYEIELGCLPTWLDSPGPHDQVELAIRLTAELINIRTRHHCVFAITLEPKTVGEKTFAQLRADLVPNSSLGRGEFDMEILVRDGDGYLAMPLTDKEGRPFSGAGLAFVHLEPKCRFAVRLINRSSYDAAIALSVDGLNVFEFAKDRRPRYFFVPKQESIVVAGWRRTSKRTDLFTISEYSKHRLAKTLVNPDEVRTVTALFHAAWESPQEKPIDERGRLLADGQPDRLIHAETGGPRRKVVERNIGRARAIVNIRYPKHCTSVNEPENQKTESRTQQ